MDDLSTLLRATAAEPPPTRIDLDRLIAAERQRSRTFAWTAAGTGVAAVVAAVLVTPALFLGAGQDGDPAPDGLPVAGSSGMVAVTPTPTPTLCAPLSPSPTGPQPPLQTHDTVRARPTEPVEQAVPRLTAALREALGAALAASGEVVVDLEVKRTRVEPLQDGCADPQFQFHPRYREYEVSGRIVRGSESGFLLIRVMPTGVGGQTGCPSSSDPSDCERVELPDGTVRTVEEMASPGDQRQLSVLLERPDGTSVWLIANNYSLGTGPRSGSEPVTAEDVPLTSEQLIAIASHPGLTLYP